MKDKINILLTGASGVIDRQVLARLHQDSSRYFITVFDKKTRASRKRLRPYYKQPHIRIVYGDICELEQLAPATYGQDVVIHLAAIIPPLADEKPAYAYQVNVIGSQHLVGLLQRNSPDAFLLFSSSISVYGCRVKNPHIRVTDRLQPSPGDQYGQHKIATERLIQESGLGWAIFRLTGVFDPVEPKFSYLMFDMPLDTSLEIVTARDTACAFVRAIEHRTELDKGIYNLGGGAACRSSFREHLTESFEVGGLGALDFPPYAFAERNFHCGYYMDGAALQEVLQYQQDTSEVYFRIRAEHNPPWQKRLTYLFGGLIKWALLRQSRPYRAYRRGDARRMAHYFYVEDGAGNGLK